MHRVADKDGIKKTCVGETPRTLGKLGSILGEPLCGYSLNLF